MPYVTSVERIGMQQGRQQGQVRAAQDMILEVVAARFGAVPNDILVTVLRLESREALHGLLRQAATCPTVEALRESLPTAL